MDNNMPPPAGNPIPPPAYPPSYPPPPAYSQPPIAAVPVYAPPPAPAPQYTWQPAPTSPLSFILAFVALVLGLILDPLLTFAFIGGGLTGAILMTTFLALAGIGLGIWAIAIHHGSGRPTMTLALSTAGIALGAGWFVLAMFFWLAKPYFQGLAKMGGFLQLFCQGGLKMQPLTCYNHPARAASATCADCGAPICAACTHMLRDQPFCSADYAIMRREPAGAHLPTEVPAYQLPQYRQAQPALTTSAPVPSGSLLGSELVTVASAPLGSSAQTRIPPDAIQKWARVGFACALLAIVGIIFAYFIALTGRVHAPKLMIVFFAVAVAAITGIGLVISAVTLLLRQRSDNVREVTQIGCLSIIINGVLIGIYLFVFVTLGAYLH